MWKFQLQRRLKHEDAKENTDGLKVCPKILLMEEIRLTSGMATGQEEGFVSCFEGC